jgi:hypothetical protein
MVGKAVLAMMEIRASPPTVTEEMEASYMHVTHRRAMLLVAMAVMTILIIPEVQVMVTGGIVATLTALRRCQPLPVKVLEEKAAQVIAVIVPVTTGMEEMAAKC